MKRIACTLAAAAWLLALGSRADDKVEVQKDANHARIEKKHTRGHHTDKLKVESSARHRMGGGSVSKTETTEEHSRPGIGNDSKTKTTETVERDAAGNIIRHEKKTGH